MAIVRQPATNVAVMSKTHWTSAVTRGVAGDDAVGHSGGAEIEDPPPAEFGAYPSSTVNPETITVPEWTVITEFRPPPPTRSTTRRLRRW